MHYKHTKLRPTNQFIRFTRAQRIIRSLVPSPPASRQYTARECFTADNHATIITAVINLATYNTTRTVSLHKLLNRLAGHKDRIPGKIRRTIVFNYLASDSTVQLNFKKCVGFWPTIESPVCLFLKCNNCVADRRQIIQRSILLAPFTLCRLYVFHTR